MMPSETQLSKCLLFSCLSKDILHAETIKGTFNSKPSLGSQTVSSVSLWHSRIQRDLWYVTLTFCEFVHICKNRWRSCVDEIWYFHPADGVIWPAESTSQVVWQGAVTEVIKYDPLAQGNSTISFNPRWRGDNIHRLSFSQPIFDSLRLGSFFSSPLCTQV